MSSIILRTTARPLAILLATVALLVLLRGHNEPGGGFIAGLFLAAACSLYAIAYGVAQTRSLLRRDPRVIIGTGLLLVAGAAVFSLALGQSPLTAQWWIALPLIGKVGTVLVFDTGVCLTVFGASMVILLTLKEEA